MSEQYSYIWFAHKQVKETFLEKNNIIKTYPLLEYLIAANSLKIDNSKDVFTIKELKAKLVEYRLPHHQQTVYRTAGYLKKKKYIQRVIGRQYFTPEILQITVKGLKLLASFESFLKQSLG